MSLRKTLDCLVYFRERYQNTTSRKEKSAILDEVCTLYQYSRKAAIRYLNRTPGPSANQKRPGPKTRYDSQRLLPILKQFWQAADYPCSLRLKAILPLWLPAYEQEYGPIETELRKQLINLSRATIDRLLKPTRIQLAHKGRSGTKPGSLIKQHIPIKVDQWNEAIPGFVEADTVALCGNSLAGNFVWCLTLTDIASGWTEIRATWNKGAAGVLHQIQHIEQHLPFPLKGFDCDNGTEFLNHHLLAYWQQHENVVQFTRSRPYKKNDNAHVEQKNYSHVRALFGYDRFQDERLVPLMNDLLQHEQSLLHNHFMPASKLVNKERINSKIKKTHDLPKTPYERLMLSPHLPNIDKVRLAHQHLHLNPFTLKREIERKLKHIFTMVSVTPNVRHRL